MASCLRISGEVRDVRGMACADVGSDFAVIEGKIRISIDSDLSQQSAKEGDVQVMSSSILWA